MLPLKLQIFIIESVYLKGSISLRLLFGYRARFSADCFIEETGRTELNKYLKEEGMGVGIVLRVPSTS